jgi:hypothetical protein
VHPGNSIISNSSAVTRLCQARVACARVRGFYHACNAIASQVRREPPAGATSEDYLRSFAHVVCRLQVCDGRLGDARATHRRTGRGCGSRQLPRN